MKLKTYLLALFCLFSLPAIAGCNCTGDPLDQRINSSDKRYPTFHATLDLMHQRNVKTLVETGTARNGASNCIGDGCSTLILGLWAKQNGALLYTVDISKNAIKNAKKASKCYADHIVYVCKDSISFLKDFPGTIDFLYLDSYDYDFNNPAPSQEHHLKEIEAAYPHLHDQTIVLIDDCNVQNGGKGKLVIDYLLERGWYIEMDAYQVLLLKQ